jgi:hypothetical protein
VRLSSGALDEVRRWVMSFGRHAKVIAPAALAAEIAAEAAEVAQMYSQDENL